MPKTLRLSQVIAIEKQVKSRTNGEGAELHKANQKADLFTGLSRAYEKKDEEGEDLPGEQKIVQMRAGDNLAAFSTLWVELVDVVATKDWGNCSAKADLVVNGQTLVQAMPVTHLIWLEKQLDDLRTFIEKLPVLDPSRTWRHDPSSNLYVTDPVKTARSKDVPRVLVKAEATDKHPAQTEVVKENVIVGYWSSVSQSGALPESRRRYLLDRINDLRKAVKQAREEANSIKVEEVSVGAKIAAWLSK
jgi:hypothetical protein